MCEELDGLVMATPIEAPSKANEDVGGRAGTVALTGRTKTPKYLVRVYDFKTEVSSANNVIPLGPRGSSLYNVWSSSLIGVKP